MNHSETRILIALATLVGPLACEIRNACDPGYFDDHGACYPNPVDASAVADASTVADAASLLDAEPSAPKYEGFGRSCKKHSDCGGDAPTCGAPQFPICTAVNCLDKRWLCPPDWTCIDISAFSGDPTIRSSCIKL